MYFIYSLWESILLKQLAAVFYLIERYTKWRPIFWKYIWFPTKIVLYYLIYITDIYTLILIKYTSRFCLRTAGSTEGMGSQSSLWAMSSSERDSGWTIEVAVGNETTDEHTGGDVSEVSPGDGAQYQKI